jgi:surface antigen
MRKFRFIAVLALPALVMACETHQDTGAVAGAVIGGVIGNQFGHGAGKVLATAAGAVVGGVIGSNIGRDLDEADRLRAQQAEYDAFENGEEGRATEWRNEHTSHHGEVIPGRAYTYRHQRCREYSHTIYIDGEPQTMRGKACKQSDGTWKDVT